MIFFDDVIFDIQAKGGISVYFRNVFREYRELGVDYGVYIAARMSLGHPRTVAESACLRRVRKVRRPAGVPHVFVSSYYRLSRASDVSANVVIVHDFLQEKFGSGLKSKLHSKQKAMAILGADKIICVSRRTRQELLERFPEVSPDRVVVIYNGGALQVPSHGERSLRSNRLLYVGRREGYKNFPFAVECIKGLNGYSLDIVGGGALTQHEKRNLGDAGLLWVHHEAPTEIQLKSLYLEACAVVLPALDEGFGLVGVEALSLGTPVVALDSAINREILGDAPFYADDHISFREGIEKAIHISDAQKQDFMNFAGKYSWRATARGILETCESLLN